jgi:hypothetical protein
MHRNLEELEPCCSLGIKVSNIMKIQFLVDRDGEEFRVM